MRIARIHGKIDETAAVLLTRTAASNHPPAYTGRTAMSIIRIPLSQGKFALINREDELIVSQHNWHEVYSPRSSYASTHIPNGDGTYRVVGMHRLILGAREGEQVDHIDHDGLNNTRSNIRIVTPQQNVWNQRVRRDSASGYKGVTLRKDRRREMWRAKITRDRKRIHIGYFNTAEDAARAYDRAAMEMYGEYAFLNFPDEQEPE